ncbi:hypothetical protein, partial [Prevotella sp. P5-92]|uniref:hypothetical protein n=1 Tax=Prevotella sp. P5-92 TaxID=2024222 RepID=UPI001C1F4ADF
KSKETYSQSFQIDGSFTQSISRLLLVLLLLCYVNLSKNSSYSRSREALFSKASAKVRQKSIRSKHFGKKLSFFNIRLQIIGVNRSIILYTPFLYIKRKLMNWQVRSARMNKGKWTEYFVFFLFIHY